MTKLAGKTARSFCDIALPLAALATDPDVGRSPDDAPDKVFEPFAEFLAAVIRGDAEQMRAATEAIIEARTGEGSERANADVTRHGRKRSVLLKRDGDDSTERGTTRHGRRAGILVDNE